MIRVTASEWRQRCAARFMECGGLTEARANECARECWAIAGGENDGTSSIGNPEEAADDEMACWEDDGAET